MNAKVAGAVIAIAIACLWYFSGTLKPCEGTGCSAAAATNPSPTVPPKPAGPTSQMPRAADSVVDEIGIDVHFGYVDTGYRFLTAASPAPNGSSVVRTLATLGVRHVRSGVLETESKGLGSTGPSVGPRGRCAAFQAASADGEDFDLVTDIDDTKTHINTSESDLGIAVACFGPYAGHIAAIEGPNERGSGRDCEGTEPPPAPNMAPYIGTFRKTPTSECIPEILGQQRIMMLARRDRVVPASTQLWSGAFANTACEEEYDIAHYSDSYGRHLYDYVDAVTSHAYLAFNEPEYTGGSGPYKGVPCSATSFLNGGDSNVAYDFINDAAYGSLRYYFEAARYSGVAPGGNATPKPALITETGYEATCCGNADTDVDVPTVTKYTIRELLATQAAGFTKEFIYELVSDSESLGLTDQYLNPKPVYYALENFIKLLRDPGYAALSTRPFVVRVQAPGDVQSELYQKHDGTNWLILWQNDRGYDHATMSPVHVAPTTARVTFGQRATSLTFYVFDSTTGLVKPQALPASTAVVVPVTDMPAILQIGGNAIASLAIPLTVATPLAVQRRQTAVCTTTGGASVTCRFASPLASPRAGSAAIAGHILVLTALGNPNATSAPSTDFQHDGGASCGANDAAEVAHRVVRAGDPNSWTFTPAAGAIDTQYTLDELQNARLPLGVTAGCIEPHGTSYTAYGGRIALPDSGAIESYMALRLSGSTCGSFAINTDEFEQLSRLDSEVCSTHSAPGGDSVFAEGSSFGGFSAEHRPTLRLPGVTGLTSGPHASLTWWVAHT